MVGEIMKEHSFNGSGRIRYLELMPLATVLSASEGTQRCVSVSLLERVGFNTVDREVCDFVI